MTATTTTAARDGLVLGVLLGNPSQNWRRRYPHDQTPRSDIQHYVTEAQQAEAAKLHTVFLADGVASSPQSVDLGLEPTTLLSALALQTERVGLIGSISTSFFEPFNVARQVASLDHISAGRAGWNLVTSAAGGPNFGKDDATHDTRYEIAEEFAGVVDSLWESWDSDAVVADRERNLLIDPERVRAINWKSKHFSVQGPLDIGRSPQGKPVLAQAGSSDLGKNLGAARADLVFTTGLIDVDESVAFERDFAQRVERAGRQRSEVKLIPGVAPVIGSTDEEAKRLWHEAYADLDFEAARRQLASQFDGRGFEDLGLDDAVPVDSLPPESAVEGRRSRYGVLLRLLQRGELRTVRDLVLYHASAAGHWFPIGSVERIADQLQERFERGAADGFNFLPFYNNYAHGLSAITEHLVPELQRRGLFQTEYAHSTLRENLGLPIPTSGGAR